jgi:hypothetical protein
MNDWLLLLASCVLFAGGGIILIEIWRSTRDD